MPITVSNEVLNLSASKDIVTDGNTRVFPLIYYKGYKAWVYDSTGEKINFPVGPNAENLVTAYEVNEESEVYIEYTGTFVQNSSLVITEVTVVLLCCYVILKKINRRRVKQ